MPPIRRSSIGRICPRRRVSAVRCWNVSSRAFPPVACGRGLFADVLFPADGRIRKDCVPRVRASPQVHNSVASTACREVADRPQASPGWAGPPAHQSLARRPRASVVACTVEAGSSIAASRLADGRHMAHDYERQGTTTLSAAANRAAGPRAGGRNEAPPGCSRSSRKSRFFDEERRTRAPRPVGPPPCADSVAGPAARMCALSGCPRWPDAALAPAKPSVYT